MPEIRFINIHAITVSYVIRTANGKNCFVREKRIRTEKEDTFRLLRKVKCQEKYFKKMAICRTDNSGVSCFYLAIMDMLYFFNNS
jgi:hypothetical protein